MNATSTPYTAGIGHPTYRIPVLARAGTALLAFAEGRASGSDSGDIDIVLRRSLDGGTTWLPMQTVTSNGTNTCGNPCPVVLPSGRVLLVSCGNSGAVTEAQIREGTVPAADGRRVYVQHSDDQGASWSPGTEITAQVKQPGWRWYATGPAAGVVASGRVVIPANHSLPPVAGSGDTGAEARYYGGHCIVSDDGGDTWRIGFVSSNPNGTVNENESSVALLPDGRLYFNCRDQDGTAPGTRADAYSTDRGESLALDYRPQSTITTPVVQGSLLATGDTLLYSGPAHPAERAGMAVWVSHGAGVTWEVARRITGLPAAYSSLVELDATTVGLAYETGDWSPYRRIEYVRIPLAELT